MTISDLRDALERLRDRFEVPLCILTIVSVIPLTFLFADWFGDAYVESKAICGVYTHERGKTSKLYRDTCWTENDRQDWYAVPIRGHDKRKIHTTCYNHCQRFDCSGHILKGKE